MIVDTTSEDTTRELRANWTVSAGRIYFLCKGLRIVLALDAKEGW